VYITLINPFLTLHAIFKIAMAKKNRNAINNGAKMTGIRKASFSTDLDLAKMKTFCKQN
jgi:hypothetical protein